MNSPKISILIPVFNRNKYISECIDSALHQSFQDFEVVVVDNASDDGTWEICQKYAERNPRVRVFRNGENIGPVRNWIRCAQEARGEYSKMLFSDDLLEIDCIERMLGEIVDPEVGFVYSAARVGEKKESSAIFYLSNCGSSFDKEHYLSLVLRHQAPVSPGAVMLRTKDLIVSLRESLPTATPRPFDMHGAGPDLMIMLLTMDHYASVVFIREPLVFFRNHAESFTVLNSNGKIVDGYNSAIALYLKSQGRYFAWMCYVSRIWSSRVWRQKKLISPALVLVEYEGSGSLFESVVFIIIFPVLLINLFINKMD
ncbi:MAG: glycosyltransferase family 2 protein [Ferribacterium limneticum]